MDMASSHVAPFLACLSAFASPRPSCSHGRGLHWTTLPIRRNCAAVHSPYQPRARARSDALELTCELENRTSPQPAALFVELDCGEGKPKSRCSGKKSTTRPVQCAQELEPSQSTDSETAVPKARRGRSSTKHANDADLMPSPLAMNPRGTSDTFTEISSSKKRNSKKELPLVSAKVRSVVNAEDSSDEGLQAGSNPAASRLNFAKLDSDSNAEKSHEGVSESDSADVSQRVGKSKNGKTKSGRKPRKSALTSHPETSCAESHTSIPFDSSFNDIDVVCNGGKDIVPAVLGSVERELQTHSTSSQFVAEQRSKVGFKRARRRNDTNERLNQNGSHNVHLCNELSVNDEEGASMDSSEQENEGESYSPVEMHIDTETNVETLLEHAGSTHRTTLDACEGVDPAFEEETSLESNGKPQFATLEHIKERRGEESKIQGSFIRSTRQSKLNIKEDAPLKKNKGQRKLKVQEDEDQSYDNEPSDVSGMGILEGQITQIPSFDGLTSRGRKLWPEDEICIVRWFVKAQLSSNQILFVVGADSHIGSWDPSLAIGFSAYEEQGQSHLWKAESQIPFGTHSEYNYFIQVRDGGTDSIVWRPGPKLFLVIPHSKDTNCREVTVQDGLEFNVENKLPALLWGGWWNQIGIPDELSSFLGAKCAAEIPQEQMDHSISIKSLDLPNVAKQEDRLHTSGEVTTQMKRPANEPLVENLDTTASPRQDGDDTVSKKVHIEELLLSGQISSKFRRLIRRRVLPREEPWLMESMILYERSEFLKRSATPVAEPDQKSKDMQSCVNEVADSSSPMQKKADVSTEILINSSKCTMERIAIREEGKLVELILEPVNSDINVGNIYLGVVKKLLPGMTGVFVDIGHPRTAFLSITKNRYPYTFPPISASGVESNGSVISSSPVNYLFEADGEYKLEDTSREVLQPLKRLEHFFEDDLQGDEENEDDDGEDDEEAADEEMEVVDEMEDLACTDSSVDISYGKQKATRPITVNFGQKFTKWRKVEEGMKIIVQVRKEPLGKKGPKVSAFPQLTSRFWVLALRGKSSVVSKEIQGPERKRLKDLADLFRKPGYNLTVRTEAAGQSQEDLEKDFMRLLETWKDIMERAEAASLAVENGEDDAVPALLHRAMGQTLSIVRDFFAEKVHRMVVDSALTYQEVTSYLQEVAPHLLNRVELYTGTMPIFDAFNLESEIDKLLCERVQLPNGAYLVIEETEALVSIDVNGGAGMLGKNMKSNVILEANLAAARQIAVELRLRDIGGIIVIDFIDMDESEHENLVYEEMRKAIQLDRSVVHISEISELGLMEVTRRRVRPSVTFMISDPCSCCNGTGRVESLETTLSKIERVILRLMANNFESTRFGGKTWPKVLLRVDPVMFEFLTKKQRATHLSSSLKVYIILKVGREMTKGSFEVTESHLGNDDQYLTEEQKQPSARKNPHSSTLAKKALAMRT